MLPCIAQRLFHGANGLVHEPVAHAVIAHSEFGISRHITSQHCSAHQETV